MLCVLHSFLIEQPKKASWGQAGERAVLSLCILYIAFRERHGSGGGSGAHGIGLDHPFKSSRVGDSQKSSPLSSGLRFADREVFSVHSLLDRWWS